MFKRSIPVVALAALLLVLSCAPAVAAPSIAFNFSGINGGGFEVGLGLTDHVTLVTRAGTALDLEGPSDFGAQAGFRFYLNEKGPLFVFTSLFAGVRYMVDLSGMTTYTNPLIVTASVGGGLEYRAENGAFAFWSIETNWIHLRYLPGYTYSFGFGKRF